MSTGTARRPRPGPGCSGRTPRTRLRDPHRPRHGSTVVPDVAAAPPALTTVIALPARTYPHGGLAAARDGRAVSAPCAPLLRVTITAGSDSLDVRAAPVGPGPRRGAS